MLDFETTHEYCASTNADVMTSTVVEEPCSVFSAAEIKNGTSRTSESCASESRSICCSMSPTPVFLITVPNEPSVAVINKIGTMVLFVRFFFKPIFEKSALFHILQYFLHQLQHYN